MAGKGDRVGLLKWRKRDRWKWLEWLKWRGKGKWLKRLGRWLRWLRKENRSEIVRIFEKGKGK